MDEKNANRQIKIGAMISYFGIGLSILATLIYTPWMVKRIGDANYGIYTLANSFVGLFLLDFGLSAAVTKFVAQYRAENDLKKIDWFLSCIFKMYIYIDAIVVVVLSVMYLFIDVIYKGLTQDERTLFRAVYIMVGIYSVASFPLVPIPGVLEAYEQYIQIQIINIAQKLLMVAVGVIALWFCPDVRVAVLANIVVGLMTIITKILLTKKATHIQLHVFSVRLKWNDLKEIISFSIWITILSIAGRFTYSIAPSMLGIVASSEEIALFAPANALEGYFYTISAAMGAFFLPKISRYVASKQKEDLTNLAIRIGRFQTILMGLIFIGFCAVGQDFLTVWMGENYVKSATCALILFLPDIFTNSLTIAYTTVVAENQVRRYSYGHLLMIAVSVVCMYIWGKKWGTLGVACAIATAYFVQLIWANYVYYKYLMIDMKLFYKQCYIKLLIPILTVSMIVWGISRQVFIINSWIDMIVKGIVVVIIYIGLLLFVMQRSEKDIIKKIMHRN